jgi:hypothetical protein
MWNLMIIGSIHQRPLILIGIGWQIVFNQVFLTLGDYSPQNQRELLQFSPDIKSAVDIIESKG